MSLRKSPTRTLALLAANRANAQKSTGPRTPQGKARVALNGLKHGHYSAGLQERLVRAGDREGESQYRWFGSEITQAFRFPSGMTRPEDRRQAERLATAAWCAARNAARLDTKPECAVLSMSDRVQHQLLLQIHDRLNRVGLVFWVQRRKYWTLKRTARVLFGEAPLEPPRAGSSKSGGAAAGSNFASRVYGNG